ncbi:XRE family transcriptional regulator [Enterococcus casseliflavus]|uniref:XRE family transcriptional regulator n=1 Tax=Enterococcus casseliflavus TaxID=37734 RepID=UPI003D6AB1CF
MSVFSRELDNLMNKFDMSNESLGEKVGVNRTTVSRWRSGERSPKIEKLPEIASVFNVDPRIFVGEADEVKDITTIFNQLIPPRQEKVYNFAEQQLEEQNSNIIEFPTQNNCEEVQAYLSAGTGILNYYEADKDIVEVPADAPEHDWIFKIVGDSMKPLFDTGDIVYVDKFKEGIDNVQNGRIYVVEVDGEAYIKKVYVYEDTKILRLVSLNKDYIDLLFKFENSNIKFIGRVII